MLKQDTVFMVFLAFHTVSPVTLPRYAIIAVAVGPKSKMYMGIFLLVSILQLPIES